MSSITCPACSARYAMSADKISAEGRKVKCAKCGEVWHATLDVEPETAVAEEVAAADKEPKAKPPIDIDSNEDTADIIARFEGNANANKKLEQERAQGAPAWMKMVAMVLLLVALVGGAFIYEKPLRQMGLAGLYDVLGMQPTGGLTLRNVELKVVEGSRHNRYFISGDIVNLADEVRNVPVLRVSLADANGYAMMYKDYDKPGASLAPGENLSFQAALKNRSSSVEKILLDIGSKMELALR